MTRQSHSIPRTMRRLGLMASLGAAVLVSTAAAAPAMASTPGWEILGVTGPTNVPLVHSETQQVKVAAFGGTFTLTFGGQTTTAIPYNAADGILKSALEALSSIGGAGGTVRVTGGPGGYGGNTPYEIAFGGSLANEDVSEMTADSTGLSGFFGSGHTATVSTTDDGGAGGNATIAIYATNVGGADTSGTVTVSVTLPNGITTTATPSGSGWSCSPAGAGQRTFSCTSTGSVSQGLSAPTISASIARASGDPGTSVAMLTVSGGGASSPATYKEPITGSSNPAKAGIQAFWAGAFDADGKPATQAGGHPYSAMTAFLVNTILSPSGHVIPAGDLRDVNVDLPPGFIGNPLATSRCRLVDQASGSCSPDTTVGLAAPVVQSFGAGASRGNPVTNEVPTNGTPATFVFPVVTAKVSLIGSVRSGGDYGLTITSPTTPLAYKVYGSFFTFWGDPYDPSHDSARCGATGCGAHGTTAPFLTNPTDCSREAAIGGPLTGLRVNSWQEPAVFDSASYLSPPVTGCDKLSFSPTLAFAPSSSGVDAPTGAAVDLSVPQPGLSDPGKLGTPSLKKTVVMLPKGLSVSPSAANGLEACSTKQMGLIGTGFPAPNAIHFDKLAPSCPDGSKIGTVSIQTPLLDHDLNGTVYLAAQGDNPFHSLLALYLVVNDPQTGIIIKLPGLVEPDHHTGRLTATFDDNPELPFTDLKLQFKGGAAAPLVNPSACGSYSTHSVLTAWSAPFTPDAVSDSPFAVGQDCGAGSGFSPSMKAGLIDATAGGSSSFTLRLSRDHGENVASVDTTLPRGLLAKLRGVELCPASAATTGACPAASRIGHVAVAAGPGPDPVYIPLPGKSPTAVYLSGPYKGAPYSLVIVVPAQAGPFDLGKVSVRAALYVDPETAQVTVKSDPMPQILDGIPLEYRKVVVTVDRSDFMRSPTNCRPMRVRADVHGAPLHGPVKVTPDGLGIAAAADAVAHLSNHFQVGNCAGLAFKPRMVMRLKGRHQRRDGGHPALITNVREPKHQANIKAVRVALPLSLALDPKNSQHVCNYDKAKAVHGTKAPCGKRTIVGKAVAKTPLLPHKLSARVYLVQGIRFNKEGQRIKTLPTLLVPLRGKDHVAIDLRAKTNVSHKKLVTTFRNVPDAQISSFKLRINGGKRGILVVTHNQNICRGAQVTKSRYWGQNGKRRDQNVRMKAPCKGVKKARRARRAHKIKRLRHIAHRAARHGHKTKARKALRRIHRLRHANKH